TSGCHHTGLAYQDTEQPMFGSHVFKQRIEVECRALSQSSAVGPEKYVGGPAPFVAQSPEEIPLCIQLGGVAELCHSRASDAVDAHLSPKLPFTIPGISDLPQ